MKQRMSRRRAIHLTAAAIVGMIVPFANHGRQAAALDYCYWQKLNGPYCDWGILYEDWGYRCCAGGECIYEKYERRRVGSC